MAAMEKLFVQIFDRKKWIIDQAKQQTNLFDQHLASKLIIDGIVPPPWLHSSFLHSHISHFEVAQVNKEFTSGVEFPRSPVETHRSSLNEVLVADSREELQHRLNEDAGSLNDGFAAGIGPSVLPQRDISDAGCALNCDPYFDMTLVSPLGRGGVVSEDYQDHSVSLARLHRSKSRQRALELRNSEKSARCQSRFENKNGSITGGVMGSAISLLQGDHEDELELGKPSSSCKGIDSVEEETNVCCEQKDISNCSNKIIIVGSSGLQSSSSNVGSSLNSSFKDEGFCVAGDSMGNSYQVNEQFDSPRPSSGKIGYCEEGSGYCRNQEYNFDDAEQSRLQCSSLDVDKSSCISPEDGRACPTGSPKLHSDQVDEQLNLPKPSTGNIDHREETVSGHCRSQEYNLDNALQCGPQQRSLDVDDSSCIDTGDGRSLDLSKPSSGNVEGCETTILGHCRSQGCNFDDAQQSGSHCSQDVDNSSCVDPEDRRSCPIGSSEVYSVQEKEQLDLSKSSSNNMECCEDETLRHFRGQDHEFNNAQQSGVQHSSLDADNSPCFSSKNGALCPVVSSKRHSDQVSEPLEVSRPSSVNIECHDEGLGDCRTHDCNFANNVEQSGLDKRSTSPIKELGEKTSDKKPSTFLDDKRAVNEKEKCYSPVRTSLPQIQVHSVKEAKSYKAVSESHSEKRFEDGGYLNGNTFSSADKSLQGYEKVAACSLLQSDESAEQNVSLKDGVSNENFVEIPLADTDDASVPIRDTETFSFPSAGERDSNLEQQLKASGMSQREDSDSSEGCTDDFNDNHHYISTECQIAEKSVELKTFSSVLKASSSHEKQRMVELQLENGIPASLGLRCEKPQIVNSSPIDKKLMQEFDSEKPVLEIQRLSFCEEGYLQPNASISPVEMLLLEREAHLVQGSESSPTLPIKEDRSRLGSNDRGTTLQNVTLESQSLDPKGNFQSGANELPVDTEKTEGEEENGEFSSCSLFTPHIQTSHYLGADKDMPALEGFLMQADDEQPCISVGGINLDKLDLSKCMIERASILEKLCKSACMHSPLSSSSESFKLNKVTDLYHSLPNGLLESMDLKSNLLINDQNKLLKDGCKFLNGEVNCSPHGRSCSDCRQSFSSNLAGEIKKPFVSPFGKLLDRNSLNSSSSGKRSSQNIELPCISEEAENIDEVDDEFLKDIGPKERVPLADIIENANVQVTVSEAAAFSDRLSLESLNTELSNTGTYNRTKENLVNPKSSKRKYVNEAVNYDILPRANGAKRVTRSSYNRFSRSDLSCKENFRKEGPRVSERESKHKTIVSNITSFVPLVQREAATILKGKRDIKVKAIEAAEAAKRLAEKKENERQMKKEALKLERARMEQENLRQIELEKKKKDEERKKKDEERKKKDADMAAKKRQREEEEKKEKERKRMRVEEVRRRLREHGGKLRSDKENKEAKHQANDHKPRDRKACKDATGKLDKESGHDNFDNLAVAESKTTSTSDAGRASSVVEDSKTSVDFLEAEALKNVMENRISEASEDQSYQISPYKASDDEDEDDDDDNIQNNKFVPSWASKNRIAVLFASQQKLNPEIIFPPKSFCDITEVLLPRRHQFK